LLLFDNADDPDINLRQFFPTCKHGNIIVTSRNPRCRLYAPDSHFNVSGMNAKDAIELLLKMTAAQRSPANLERAASICRELGYLALAVAQAGAYITNSCSLDDYLHIYRGDRAQLLQRHSPRAPDDYQWTVYTTWELSLKRLPPTAMMFLRICSFMHHGGISRAIFENAAVANTPGESFDDAHRFLSNFKTQTGEWSRLAFLDHTKDLLSYSLINLDAETDVYSIHPLVHAWSRDRASPVERDEARVCALQILALAVGDWQLHTAEVLALLRSLLPHVDVCRTTDVKPDIAAQLYHIYFATGRWNIAEELLKVALDVKRALLGTEHRDTLLLKAHLVYTHNQQGRWKEAEELGLQVMEMRRRVLGEEHPNTLTSMHNLATAYWGQERWKEAEKLELRVMEVRRRVLGEEHPDTLSIMSNLATTYREQGRWKEAEEMGLHVMDVKRRVLGEEHPSTLISMANLALTYVGNGRRKEAEELALQVLEKQTEVLGDNHPDTLVTASLVAHMHGWASSTQDSQTAVSRTQPLRALLWLRRVIRRR
jgi:tetratricopeptide (TPR) repeat protein